MSAPAWFERLSPEARALVVARVAGGLTDRPESYDAMVELVQQDKVNRSQLPGGASRREIEAAQARRRAGLVDEPGDEERRTADRLLRQSAAKRRDSLRGYVPNWPWQRF